MEQFLPDPDIHTTCSFCKLVQESYIKCSDVRVIGVEILETIREHAHSVHGVRLSSLSKVITP